MTFTTIASVPVLGTSLPTWTHALLSSSLGAVVLEVFEGLEDFVQHELCVMLSGLAGDHAAPVALIRTIRGCGHIVIDADVDGGDAAPAPRTSSVAAALFLASQLPAVRTAYLLAHQEAMPQDLLDALHHEAIQSGSKEARTKAHKMPIGGDGSARWTDREDELLKRLGAIWSKAEEEQRLSRTLSAWMQTFRAAGQASSSTHADTPAAPSTFRLTFERGHYLFPLIRSRDISKAISEQVTTLVPLPPSTQLTTPCECSSLSQAWAWLTAPGNGDSGQASWKVSLDHAQLDITLKLIPALWTHIGTADDEDLPRRIRNCNPAGSLAILFRLPSPPATTVPAYRQNLPAFNDLPNCTAMMRYRAAALALAASLPSYTFSSSAPSAQPAVRILEPCCGTGGMAVELAVAIARKQQPVPTSQHTTSSDSAASPTPVEIYACDIDYRFAKRSGEVFRASGFRTRDFTLNVGGPSDDRPPAPPPSATAASSTITLINAHLDASSPNALSTFVHGPDSVDLILTVRSGWLAIDLPWGFRVLNQRKLISLYTSLLASFLPVLKPGAFVYLVTAGSSILIRALQAHIEAQQAAAAAQVGAAGLDGSTTKTYALRMVELPLPSDSLSSSGQGPDLIQAGREGTEFREVVIGYHVSLCVLRKLELVIGETSAQS
ncbi:hypothetical protein OC844_005456 [Tilletia horrida]|nr:hypothetical protein OC844_005456 [Tilletia horrida]